MELVAIIRPSDGAYPGHMVIGQESATGETKFFGFLFDPETLPAEYRPAERWQEFFYSNKILGQIQDESDFVALIRGKMADSLVEKRVICKVPIESQIPPESDWKHFAYYSFRPDDFHSDGDPCYNCVTWAIMIGNKLVPDFLLPVRQGRIKLIIGQLRAEVDRTGDKDA